jgi:hypothetical protein
MTKPPNSYTKWLPASGALFISIAVHVLIFLVVGGIVIFEGQIGLGSFESLNINPDAPLSPMEEEPLLIEDEIELPSMTTELNTVNETPEAAALGEANLEDLIVSSAVTTQSFLPSTGRPDGVIGGITGGLGNLLEGTGAGGSRKAPPTPFGYLVKDGDSLDGFFYDLKRLANGSPSGLKAGRDERRKYEAILSEIMLQKGERDFSVYDKYLRAPNTLYRNVFVTPGIKSSAAPAAFGVEAEGGMWLAYYSGYISPPESGKYKFSASADNMITLYLDGEVAVHGNVGGYAFMKEANYMKRDEGYIRLKDNRRYFAEVMIGDDGGMCWSRIYVQKKGMDGTHAFQVGEIPESEADKHTGGQFQVNQLVFKSTSP